jgi:hypothetical protein
LRENAIAYVYHSVAGEECRPGFNGCGPKSIERREHAMRKEVDKIVAERRRNQ